MISWFFPVLNTVDNGLAFILPDVIRYILWAVISGAAGMGLYALCSNQDKLKDLKSRIKSYQKQMLDTDLEDSEYKKVILGNLALSFNLLGRTLGPALVSALPIVIILFWIGFTHSYTVPQGTHTTAALWLSDTEDDSESEKKPAEELIIPITSEDLSISYLGSEIYSGNPWNPPTPEIHHKVWWNILVSSPVGYIVPESDIAEIQIDLERKYWNQVLPGWMSSWEFVHYFFLIAISLFIKFYFRIE